MSAAPSHFCRGDSLGRYLVLDTLGRGGMGVVLRAFDPELDRTVAIKVVTPEGRGDSGSRKQLLREGQAMARLVHPNVVTVHDVGIADGDVFIAMELVDGVNLERWLASPRSLDAILEVFIQCARGLAAAHDAGLAHGDFKPANVLVATAFEPREGQTDGEWLAKVTDFGLARPVAIAEPDSVSRRDRFAMDADEVAGGGTQGYLAPECVDGGRSDERADQYALCVALREATAARTATTLPLRLRRILHRGLAIDPAARFESMHALVHELERVRRRRSILGRRIGAIAFGGLVVTVVVTGVRAPSPCRPTASETEIWTDGRRARIGAQLESRVFARLETILDGHARQLADGRQRACEAAMVRHEQSRELYQTRSLCYEHAWVRLDALLDVLEHSSDLGPLPDDPEATLLPPVTCGRRAELLLQLPAVPSGKQPRVDEIRRRLARADARLWSGRLDQASAEADEALRGAQGLDYPPLHAEALLTAGLVAIEAGNYDVAQRRLGRAHWTAQGVRHDRIALHSAISMAEVVGVHLEQLERGDDWLHHAEAAASRYADDGPESIDLENTRAAVLLHHGRFEDALAAAERARQQLESMVARRPLREAAARQLAAVALESLGRLPEAERQYRRALAIIEDEFGSDHPRAGQLLHNLAVFHHTAGDYAASLRASTRALAVKRSLYGEDHPSIARSLQGQGVALLELDRGEEAWAAVEAAASIVERTLGPEHPEMGVALVNVGAAATETGRLDAAEDAFRRALAILGAHFGDDHPLRAEALEHRARLRSAQGDREGAREDLEAALEVLDPTAQPERWGWARIELADVLLSLGRGEEAVRAATDGLEALERVLADHHPRRREAQAIAARIRDSADKNTPGE